MKKIKPRFKSLLLLTIAMAVLLLTGCPVAPPTEPMEQYKPYLTPASVTTLTATNGYENEITLRWDEVPNATSYQIWQVKASDYGAISNPVKGDMSFHKLLARGFELLDVTEDVKYIIKNCSHNDAYVYTVVAMRSIGSGKDRNVLYSDVGSFVEGSTVGDVSLNAVALTDEVVLTWQVNNFYTVLPEKPGHKDKLYKSEFSISYRRMDEKTPTIITNTEIGDADYFRMDMLDKGLQLNTDYIFSVTMKVFNEEGKVVSTVNSVDYPIRTTSNFNIAPVESVTASQGSEKDAIVITWKAPALPSGVYFDSIFEIQRAVYNEDPKALVWKTVLDVDTSKTLSPVDVQTREYSWTDNTAGIANNTKYLYRVKNGYIIKEKNIMQKAAVPVTETVLPGYKIWIPENASFVKFTKGAGENPLTGTVDFKIDFMEPPAEGAEWNLTIKKWNGETFTETKETEPVTPIKAEGGFTLSKEISITEAESSHDNVFTFELSYKYKDLTKTFEISPKGVSLGLSAAEPLFDPASFVASNDYIGKIILSWTVSDIVTEETQYELLVGDSTTGLNIVPTVSAGNVRTFVLEDQSDASKFRLKLTGKIGETTYSYACPDQIEGDVLRAPAKPDVSDSISRDNMTVSWKQISSNILYTLEAREKGTGEDQWKNIDIPAEAFVAEANETVVTFDIPKDGLKPGAVYEFRLKAANEIEPELYTDWSSIEEGSLFGSSGMALVVVDNGLNADKINLKWNPVIGANFYEIYRSVKGDTETPYEEYMKLPGKVTAPKTEYGDNTISLITADSTNPVPLSAEYNYVVVPRLNDNEIVVLSAETASNTVSGSLFAPPKSVKASKAESAGKIDITWTPVPHAEGYMIKPYTTDGKGGFKSLGPAIEVRGATTYSDSTVYMDKEKGQPIVNCYYTVMALGAGQLESKYQDSFITVKDEIGTDLPENLGYKLTSPQNFFPESVILKDTKLYADYVVLKWKRAPGATNYRISNSLMGASEGTNVDILGLDYASENELITNGLDVHAPGYLSYNKATQEYTYNDDAGKFRTSAVIYSYSIRSRSKDGAESTVVTNSTVTYRQIDHEELLNVVNYSLNNLLHNADVEFTHDWFWGTAGYENIQKFYHEPGAEVFVWQEGWTAVKKGGMNLNGYSRDGVCAVLTTEQDMVCTHNYESGAGKFADGDDPLKFLYGGVITVQVKNPDGKILSGYPVMKVAYPEEKNKLDVTKVNNNIQFTVTIGDDVKVIKDGNNIERPF